MFGFGPTHAGEDELTLELLEDAIKLTHPDLHPPERADLAHRVTAELLALRPYVLPAPKPVPSNGSKDRHACRTVDPLRPSTSLRDTLASVGRAGDHKPVTPSYPCDDCRGTWYRYYCDSCRATYETKEREKRERESAKRRERRAEQRANLPRTKCSACGEWFKANRKDAAYCSAACRNTYP